MSLWTPDGEHRVPRSSDSTPPPTDPSGVDIPLDEADLDPQTRAEAEALAAEMAEVRRQLLSAPAAVVVANHAMGLYELAAIHLGAPQPNLSEAQVAIDAYGALVDALGDRLGPDEATLRDALAQIRLAFVQIKAGVDDAATPDDGSGTPPGQPREAGSEPSDG